MNRAKRLTGLHNRPHNHWQYKHSHWAHSTLLFQGVTAWTNIKTKKAQVIKTASVHTSKHKVQQMRVKKLMLICLYDWSNFFPCPYLWGVDFSEWKWASLHCCSVCDFSFRLWHGRRRWRAARCLHWYRAQWGTCVQLGQVQGSASGWSSSTWKGRLSWGWWLLPGMHEPKWKVKQKNKTKTEKSTYFKALQAYVIWLIFIWSIQQICW